MQIKNLFLLSCLLAAALLSANNPTSSEFYSKASVSLEGGCNLPAPTNFVADNIGPDWVHLSWDLTNPGYQHRINVYSCVDSNIVQTLVVNGGVNDVTINLLPIIGGLYYFEIKAICFSGDSPNSAWIQCIGPNGTGVILELVVNGLTPPAGTADCTMRLFGGGETCGFSNVGTTPFRIRMLENPQIRRDFTMERAVPPPNEANIHLKLGTETPNDNNDPNGYQVYVNYQSAPSSGKEYQIMRNAITVARFIAEVNNSGQCQLRSVSINTGYEIVRIVPSGNSKPTDPPGGERTNNSSTASLPASAYPNPFSQVLNVFPGNPSAAQIHLQMYNLSGQKILDQQFPGGQEQYALSTEALSPGFYFLRIEADGAVQTLKVVKSE